MPHQLPPAASVEKALTVSQLNAQIESQLKILGRLWVEGEVSSIKYHRSKHWYFDIKDRDSCVSCVMFSKNNRTMTWQPKVGDKVRLSGTLSVYSPRGTYSFVTYRIEKAGLGEYLIRLAELRKKLQVEGLFDQSRKRKLPFLPRRIGIAT
ncbi:MAG: exodeoxyribonuclease VII large subunit, partial [Myxococcota bacterium]|nr:exodeoxyribonuclease VII large subunit [Myxococcota bacterium]